MLKEKSKYSELNGESTDCAVKDYKMHDDFHISSGVANIPGDKASYIKQRGVGDSYGQKIIVDDPEQFETGERAGFEKILLDKLPDVLDIAQKKNKVKNNL